MPHAFETRNRAACNLFKRANMIAKYFSALLPFLLTASLQTVSPTAPSPPSQPQNCPVTIQGNLRFTSQAAQPISAIIFHAAGLN